MLSPTEEDFPLRLVDGSSSRDGIVEIFFNGRWGKICNLGWDSADASVVCRQLGLYGANVSLIYDTKNTNLDYLREVGCKGDEAKLIDCTYTGWRVVCLKYAGVMCQMGKITLRYCLFKTINMYLLCKDFLDCL